MVHNRMPAPMPDTLDPVTENMGILCEQTDRGASVATLDATADHCNRHGFVHGAVLFAMADIGMGSAVATALGHEQRVVSLSINVNYVRPAGPGRIKAHSMIVRLGKTIAVARAQIENADGSVCALVTADFHVSDYA